MLLTKGLKGQFTQKNIFCHHLLTLMFFQTHMSFLLLLNTKEDIGKNLVTKQMTVASDFYSMENTMDLNGYHQL